MNTNKTDEELSTTNRLTCSLLIGISLFIIGLIIDDVYTVVTGLSLIIIGTISTTGDKITHHLDRAPKDL